jgi:hypothetical protein
LNLPILRLKSATLALFRERGRWIALALLVVAVEVIYLYVITAGTMKTWPTWTRNYDLQAEGFRAGHLYLTVAPPPELLAQPNPYDWANQRLWFWDAILYEGRYYLYWGPFPAFALAAIKIVFGINEPIGDQYPTFAFYSLHLIAGTLLIERVARRLFPAVPFVLVVAAVLAFALGNPTPYMIASPAIYEAAIAGAQAFVLLGLVFAFDAVWSAETSPPRRAPLVLAGVSWAIAIACRASLGPPVLLLCVAVLAVVFRRSEQRPLKTLLVSASWLAGPVGLGVGLLLAYNKARFGSWLDFGMSYILNTLPFVTKSSFVPLNVYSYLLRPMDTVCRFPFVSGVRDIAQRGFPEWIRMPEGYWTGEPLVGLLRTTPWVWLSAVAIYRFSRRAWCCPRATLRSLDRSGRLHLWAGACFGMLATIPAVPFIAVFCATMRYVADFSSGAILLATVSAFGLYQSVRDRPSARRLVMATCLVLAGATIVLGLLFGIQGYDDMFKWHNPRLFEAMVRDLSLCRWFPAKS